MRWKITINERKTWAFASLPLTALRVTPTQADKVKRKDVSGDIILRTISCHISMLADVFSHLSIYLALACQVKFHHCIVSQWGAYMKTAINDQRQNTEPQHTVIVTSNLYRVDRLRVNSYHVTNFHFANVTSGANFSISDGLVHFLSSSRCPRTNGGSALSFA